MGFQWTPFNGVVRESEAIPDREAFLCHIVDDGNGNEYFIPESQLSVFNVDIYTSACVWWNECLRMRIRAERILQDTVEMLRPK
jgi:hypothetical protein